jgi:SPX domain protein involved in polyphosphate accumulation
MESHLNKLKERKQISEKEWKESITLSTEIQNAILEQKLEPAVTTRYIRTAFQQGRDNTGAFLSNCH